MGSFGSLARTAMKVLESLSLIRKVPLSVTELDIPGTSVELPQEKRRPTSQRRLSLSEGISGNGKGKDRRSLASLDSQIACFPRRTAKAGGVPQLDTEIFPLISGEFLAWNNLARNT